ncbi:MAG: hypothetical protein V1910_00030 [bacterium]
MKIEENEQINFSPSGEKSEDDFFNEVVKIPETTWKKIAVSGVLQFDKERGKQILQSFTDLDGRSALGILKMAGIDTSNLIYVRPGKYLEGAVNLDTGDKFGVVYDEETQTAFFDHHAKGIITSTTKIVYKAMMNLQRSKKTDLAIGLKPIEKTEAMDKLVDFVTKIDNRQFPPEEFLKSAKTILGLCFQKDLDFNKLLAYFKEHASPMEELTIEELEKYGLKDSAEKQQKIIDGAMETLERMEKEGKIIDTKYGKIVINKNNELKVGSSAAYVKFDGIINITPEKSFAVTLKEGKFDEEELKNKLGDKFQGKIIRGNMWIYNDKEPLNLSMEELINSLK